MDHEDVGAVEHCGNPSCDLGALHYKCVHCHKLVTDYESWWSYQNWLCTAVKSYTIECPKCKHTEVITP